MSMQQSYVNCSPSECLLTENIAGLMQSPLPSSAIKPVILTSATRLAGSHTFQVVVPMWLYDATLVTVLVHLRIILSFHICNMG